RRIVDEVVQPAERRERAINHRRSAVPVRHVARGIDYRQALGLQPLDLRQCAVVMRQAIYGDRRARPSHRLHGGQANAAGAACNQGFPALKVEAYTQTESPILSAMPSAQPTQTFVLAPDGSLLVSDQRRRGPRLAQ